MSKYSSICDIDNAICKFTIDDIIKYNKKNSNAGVIPKATLAFNPQTNILSKTISDDFDYIAKLSMWKKDFPENEHFFIWLANQTSMDTSDAKLINYQNTSIFLSKNFLKENQRLIPFSQLINRPIKSSSMLDEYLDGINKLETSQSNLRNIHTDTYKQFLFSNIIGNFDLHSRNISLISSKQNNKYTFKIAPAYDIVCTRAYFNHEGSSIGINGKFEEVNLDDLIINFKESTLLSLDEILKLSKDMIQDIYKNIPEIKNSKIASSKQDLIHSYIENRIFNYVDIIKDIQTQEEIKDFNNKKQESKKILNQNPHL